MDALITKLEIDHLPTVNQAFGTLEGIQVDG